MSATPPPVPSKPPPDFGAQFEAESWAEFKNIVVSVWNHGVGGVDIGKILVALGILLGFFMIRRLFSRVVLNRAQKLADETETHVDNQLLAALKGPLRFIPVLLGVFFATQYLELDEGWLAEGLARLLRSLVAFTIFWALYNMVTPLRGVFDKLESLLSRPMVDWMIKALKVAVALIGAAAILEVWGIRVAPLIAGLGLFGVAVALGAQDLFKNLIAGILILAERRFTPGDWVKVDGVVEGTVETIGFRSTRIRRFDKAPVYVPNAKLSDSAVTNFSKMTNRRIYWKIGVTYNTSVDQLREIRDGIERYIHATPEFETGPAVSTFVRIDAFSDSSIDIMLYCFTKTTNWGEWLKIKEDFACHIKEVVEGAGSSFAFPSRSLYIEAAPDTDQPEAFVPPSQ
ncbi:MAG: mechanosensitive ion channel family protein [Alphaproteobacteria bacterium]